MATGWSGHQIRSPSHKRERISAHKCTGPWTRYSIYYLLFNSILYIYT
jgi:hypothetical protein